jgi:hypothetical protein
MEKFHWDYEQYENRPLWFDVIYPMKLEAEAKHQEAETKRAERNNG